MRWKEGIFEILSHKLGQLSIRQIVNAVKCQISDINYFFNSKSNISDKFINNMIAIWPVGHTSWSSNIRINEHVPCRVKSVYDHYLQFNTYNFSSQSNSELPFPIISSNKYDLFKELVIAKEMLTNPKF